MSAPSRQAAPEAAAERLHSLLDRVLATVDQWAARRLAFRLMAPVLRIIV